VGLVATRAQRIKLLPTQRLVLTIAVLIIATSSASGLDFRIHTVNSKKLNAVGADGKINKGDAQRLAQILRNLPSKPNTAVYLSSPGGNLYEGMRLGLLFRRAKVKTVIEGGKSCASACALAFLGGRDNRGNRWMSSTTTSRLGIHAFRLADGTRSASTDRTQRIIADILEYARLVEAPAEILVKTFRTPSRDIYWLRTDELLRLGVRVWDMQRNCFVPCA
jgi:hypothetical protein